MTNSTRRVANYLFELLVKDETRFHYAKHAMPTEVAKALNMKVGIVNRAFDYLRSPDEGFHYKERVLFPSKLACKQYLDQRNNWTASMMTLNAESSIKRIASKANAR